MDWDWRVVFAVAGLAIVLIVGLNMALRIGDRALLHQERQADTRARVEIAQAQPANVPAHYAPHIQLTQAPDRAALPGPAGAVPNAPAIFTVPSTRALLDQGLIAAGRPLPVWTAAGPLYLSSGRLWTAGIGGRSGGGKTRTAGLLIGFEALNGADVLAIDPHRHKDDSLSRLIAPLGDILLLPPAFSEAEVEAVLSRAAGELDERRAGRKRGRVLLVIDEYTSYQRRGGPLAQRMARLVEEYATEGRGYDCQALVMGQNWKASRSGGTEVREVLTSAIVHRSWKRQAAYLCPDDETAEAAESLVPGRAIFVPADDDPIEIGIPLTESADLARIAAMRNATSRPFAAPSPPLRVVPRDEGNAVAREGEILGIGEVVDELVIEYKGHPLSAEFIAQVRALFEQDCGPSDITKALSPSGSNGGDLAVKVGLVYQALVKQLRADMARQSQKGRTHNGL